MIKKTAAAVAAVVKPKPKTVAGILGTLFSKIDELRAHQEERAIHAAGLRAQVVTIRQEAFEAEQEVLRAGNVATKIEALVS